MWGNQENMHIQYSDTLINILRITETHIYTNLLSANYGVERRGRVQIMVQSGDLIWLITG
jgi:hypothetical protein